MCMESSFGGRYMTQASILGDCGELCITRGIPKGFGGVSVGNGPSAMVFLTYTITLPPEQVKGRSMQNRIDREEMSGHIPFLRGVGHAVGRM